MKRAAPAMASTCLSTIYDITPPKTKAVGKIQVRGYESNKNYRRQINTTPKKDRASIKLFLPHFASRRLGRLHTPGPV